MKSILYVGATLMIGASIYGFVDYKQTSHKKEFKEMYAGEKTKEPAVVTTAAKTEAVASNHEAVTSKTSVIKKKAAKKNETLASEKTVSEDVTVAPVKPIAEDEKINSGELKTIEIASVNVTPSKDDIARKYIKKKKRLSTKSFSRAPLREDIEELPAPVKKESKKAKD